MRKIYLLLIIGFFSSFTHAQWTQLGANIYGEAADDRNGHAVCINGDGTIIAMSAYLNDFGGSNAGQIRVFQLLSGTWVQMGGDIYGENAGDIARAVSLSDDGMRVAVGAQYNDGTDYEAGNVRVYEYNAGVWTQLGADVDGEAAEDWSGYDVALSGNGQRLAIGAPKNDGNGSNSGHVRVYEYITGAWTQIGSDLDGEGAEDQFGNGVSLDYTGQRLAVGAPLNDGNGTDAGHARIFEFGGGIWTQLGSDIDAEAFNDYFGHSVALSGDGSRVIVGGFNNDGAGGSNSGHARIFEYSAGTWSQVGADLDGDASDDNFGIAVDINYNGSNVVVGAYRNNSNGHDTGQAKIFNFNGGAWVQLGADLEGAAGVSNHFGRAVGMSNNGYSVIIGENANDDYANNAGRVAVYSHPIPCNNTTGSATVSACDSYTAPSADETYTTLGTYTVFDTIPNVSGCDSLLTITLTLSTSSASTDVQTSCPPFIWIDGNSYTSSNNTATHTIVGGAANGCDSIVTLNLTIEDVSAPVADLATLSNVTSECEVTSLTAPTATDNCAGSITGTHNAALPITSQGTTVVTWTYDDGNGNTSTQTQNVVIDDVTAPVANMASLTNVISECSVTSLTAPTAIDNCAGSVTGTHNASLPITTQGTTVVTWTYDDGNGNTTTQTQNVVISDNTNPVADVANLTDINSECEVTPSPPTATDNCTGTITGTPNVTFPITASGTTTITWTYDDGNGNTSTQAQIVIITPIDNGVTQVDAVTLSADATGYSYQWIDCDNGNQSINGETSQTFVATDNGNYAVEISNGNCAVISNCSVINQVGISEIENMELLKVYPNPTNGIVHIDSSVEVESIELIDALGKTIAVFAKNQQTIELKTVPGVYLLKIKVDGKERLLRVVKL